MATAEPHMEKRTKREVKDVAAEAMAAALPAGRGGGAAAEAANPFASGEAVVYPAHGVGRIDGVGFEDIAGQRLNMIRISFADHEMTLRVPVSHARAAGLRRLASAEALASVLATLRGRPRHSRVVWARRSQEYLAKINSGDPGALAEVVRDLQAAGEGTHSSFSQRNLFELALDRLAGEFAAARQMGKEKALALLLDTLAWARSGGPAPAQPSLAEE